MSVSEAEVLHDQMEARQVIIAISGMALGPTGYEIVCVCVYACVSVCLKLKDAQSGLQWSLKIHLSFADAYLKYSWGSRSG